MDMDPVKQCNQLVVASTSESTPVKAGNGAQVHGCSSVQHRANVPHRAHYAYMSQQCCSKFECLALYIKGYIKGTLLCAHHKGFVFDRNWPHSCF